MNCTCKFLPGNKIAGLPDELRPRFFSGLGGSELDAIVSVATHRRFLGSSVIVHEEDPADRLFLLTSGRGRHFVLTGNGRKILLHWLTAGQIFGGAAMISSPSKYLASTEVLSDSCALVWDREVIREMISRMPRLLDNAFSIAVTEHIAWLVAAKVSLSAEDAESRIAQLLVSLACGIGNDGPEGVVIPVGNEDLAAAANVTPYTVSRSLSKWQQEGILRKGRNRVILLQPERLVRH